MKPSHHKLLTDLNLANYSDATIRDYFNYIRRLEQYHGRDPKDLSDEEVKDFLRYLKVDLNYQPSSLNVVRCALMFYYTAHVAREEELKLPVQKGRVEKKLPKILSRAEVEGIFDAAETSKQRAMLMCGYGLGLRNSEVRYLRVEDIDGERKEVHVHLGKGGKSRILGLPQRLHEELRGYYRQYWPKPEGLLFPGFRDPGDPVAAGTLNKWFHKARIKSGSLKSQTSYHTLRHTFATHLLEQGKGVREVQRLLGHKSIVSTLVYIHVASGEIFHRDSPLDVPPDRHRC